MCGADSGLGKGFGIASWGTIGGSELVTECGSGDGRRKCVLCAVWRFAVYFSDHAIVYVVF